MEIINTYENLLKYTIIKRKNRLAVIVKNQNTAKQELAHLTNTGRLQELIFPGNDVLCVPNKNPGKTSIRIVAVPIKGTSKAIIIDPAEQSIAFINAVKRNLIPWLKDWKIRRPEIKIGDSRIDFQIESSNGKSGYIEVKSAAIFKQESKAGSFPDCPSTRGQKHVILMRQLAEKHRSIILFLVQHPDAKLFLPNKEADTVFSEELKNAASSGVEVRAVKMHMKNENVVLADPDLPSAL